MNNLNRRHLPPMAMLQSFAAAARCGNFTRAGQELGLTQSAVSRQISALEAWLQRDLFDRHGRRVVLNEAGQRYADHIGPALQAIQAASATILDDGGEQKPIELAVLPSFATRWLVPRLPRLKARFPNISLNLTSRDDEFDFRSEPFDAAIHFGLPHWPGVEHRFLFHEAVYPVGSPSHLRNGDQASPRDVVEMPLLAHRNRPSAWQDWAESQGLDLPLPDQTKFTNWLTIIQAAVVGSGIALVPSYLIEDEIADRKLIVLGDQLPFGEGAYYLVHPKKSQKPRLEKLARWLTEECLAGNGDQPGQA